MPKQTTAATSVTYPPADRVMSFNSSRGLSQASTDSNSGPQRYQPSKKKTRTLRPRFLITV